MRSIRRQLLSALLGIFVVAAALLGFSAPAVAHDAAESSSPAQGATVASPPEQVSVTFNKNPLGIGAQFSVKDAGGSEWADGAVEIVDNVASRKLKAVSTPGTTASPTASAGVPGMGTAQPGTTAAPEPAADASEPFPWSLVIFAAVALGLLVTIGILAKRRLTAGSDDEDTEES
jgi:methionine-rich copper-binding protein CopC